MCLSCVFHVSLKDPYGVSQRSLSCLFFSTLRIIHQNFGAENTLSCLNDGSYPTVRAPLTAVSSTLAWFRVPGYSQQGSSGRLSQPSDTRPALARASSTPASPNIDSTDTTTYNNSLLKFIDHCRQTIDQHLFKQVVLLQSQALRNLN